MNHIRPEMGKLPQHMQGLPIDERGYPVPWFVQWFDKITKQPVLSSRVDPELHYPDHRVADHSKFAVGIRARLCWTCGSMLGRYLAFVIGPMCAITRITSELPNHLECGQFAALNCPFLSRPQAIRREVGLPETKTCAGMMIERNPGVSLVYITRGYKVEPDHKGAILIKLGDPEAVYWYRQGREATRTEVIESIDSGLPILRDACKYTVEFVAGETVKHLQPAGIVAEQLQFLERMRRDIDPLLPSA